MTRSLTRTMMHLLPLVLAASPFAAIADEAGHHPAYLHALSDLRTARSLIEARGGDARMGGEEHAAVAHLDEAITEVTAAATHDGKNVGMKEPTDEKIDRAGKLHRAEDLMSAARKDLLEREDDPTTRAMRDHAVAHLDDALKATHNAIVDFQTHK